MRISAIVPALNEAENIAGSVEALKTEGFEGEVLVVDGGSDDDTVARAEAAGARVVRSARGLALQCNTGAREAQGDVLFFLAADSRAPLTWNVAIGEALSSPYVVAGGFTLAIAAPESVFRLIAFGGNFRARYSKLALPDQGLFVRRAAFEEVGGMRPDSLIPFARLSFELRALGELRLLSPVTETSPRKWQKNGLLATTLSHMATYLKYKRQELPPFS